MPTLAAGKTTISVAVVDDAAISKLNEEFLRPPGPTDVLSFLLERGDEFLDGEVVVSAETALRMAPRYGWSAGEELLLYVIHGTLHLAGYDDATPQQRAMMRSRESEIWPVWASRRGTRYAAHAVCGESVTQACDWYGWVIEGKVSGTECLTYVGGHQRGIEFVTGRVTGTYGKEHGVTRRRYSGWRRPRWR